MDSKTYSHQYSEALAEASLCKLGYFVYSSKSGKAPSDFLVEDIGGKIFRVEVKSSSSIKSSTIGEFIEVGLKSVRSNTTENTIHNFDNSKVDILAIVCTTASTIVLFDANNIVQKSSIRIYLKDMFNLETIKGLL